MATWRKTLSSNQYYEVILNVNQSSQNIANNTSSISWSLQVRKSFGSGFWGADSTASTWAVSIDGTNVSSSSDSYDFRGGAPLTKTIASGTRTITHAGDGSKSIAVSGYWKDNVNGLGSATASSTMALTTIPRASTLSAFSFASHLKNGTKNTINYTVSRKSGNFRHQIQLRDGSTTVFTWDNVSSDGASTQPLTAAEVNTLLTRMPTSTTKTFTLRIATRSGVNGGWVGSAVTRTATGTVHADVKPVLSSMTFGIDGSRIDKTINKYVQGYTKVKASVVRTAGYASSIKQTTMTVQRTDELDTQVISGTSGTTANPLSRSGSYRVVYKATDERGRSTSSTSATFAVQVYSPPTISSFTLTRDTGEKATEVTVVASGTFSSIGGSNTATLNIQRRSGTTWSNVGNNNTSTNGSITRTALSTGNLIASSYEFKARITDLFGGVAEAIDTVSTQQVVMDVYRNQGVAFGKMYEPGKAGPLQVGQGISVFDGGIHVKGPTYMAGGIQPVYLGANTDLNNIQDPGFYYCPLDAEARTMKNIPIANAFSLLVERHAGAKQTFTIYRAADATAYVRNFYGGTWGAWYVAYAPVSGTSPTLLNGWKNYSDGYSWAHAYRYHNGLILLRGMIHGGASTHGNILQLPENMRPVNREIFHCQSNYGVRRVDMQTNGFLLMTPHGKDDWLSISGITFMSSQ